MAFACFCLHAWAWTENHVLSLHEEVWKTQYASGRLSLSQRGDLAPAGLLDHGVVCDAGGRAGVAASLGPAAARPGQYGSGDAGGCGRCAILGLAMSAAEAWLWQLWLDTVRQGRGPEQPGVSLRRDGLGRRRHSDRRLAAGEGRANLTTRRLAFISAGAMTIWALVVRERAAGRDRHHGALRHAPPGRPGGGWECFLFFAVNAAVITACVLIVKRALYR